MNNGFDSNSDIPPFAFGKAGDIPIVGDWDGDGITDIGVVRGNGWYLSTGFDGSADILLLPRFVGEPWEALVH